MELLETREAELRGRVLGPRASPASTHATHTVIERIQRINSQLEQLSATISGFSRLTELYEANREMITLNRSVSSPASGGGDSLKRAVILSSEDHITGVVAEFKRLKELQRYIGQLEQVHTTSAQAQSSIDGIELTHTQQEERALLLHGRVERILGVYQEMIQVLSEKCVEYSTVLDQLTA